MGHPINGRRLLLLAAVALAVDSVTAQPDYFNPKNFNPSMAIAMVVLVTAFFLLGFFSIYLRRCAGPPLGVPDDHSPLRLGLPGLGLTYASRSRRTPRGLDRAVLDSFPTMAYADVREHKEGKGKGGALECAVCLSEFDDGDTLRLLLPRCNHAFHADCIDAWLASHVTCPVCRSVLAPAPDAADALQDAVVVPGLPATDHDGQVVIPPVVVPAADAVAGETTAEEEQRVRREEAAELLRIGSVKRALRTKSGSGRRPGQFFPRSHTTGHSLAAAPSSHSPSSSSTTTSDSERYTLRLPDHVLREAVAAGNLRRSASVYHQTGGGDGTTTRRGFGVVARAGRSVRLGSSGRWPNMSLLARTFSAARLPVWGSVRRGEADGDAPAKGASKFAGDDDHGKATVVEPQCDGGACSLADHV